MFAISLGHLRVEIHLPDTVLTAMLPAYLQPIDADIFPSRALHLHLHPLAEAPPATRDITGRFGLGRAFVSPPDESTTANQPLEWDFYLHLPIGPDRPDRLPTKCVLPALYVALAHLGVNALHASGVLYRDEAILFAGPSGCGKTTGAVELVERGALPLADDRVLAWADGDRLLVTPSCERPNPFARRVGYPAESGPLPRRIDGSHGTVAPVSRFYFPTVVPDAPSSIDPLSPAAAHACAATLTGNVDFSLPRILPGARLTLGTRADTIFDRLLSPDGA